jgi:hypothetical protein
MYIRIYIETLIFPTTAIDIGKWWSSTITMMKLKVEYNVKLLIVYVHLVIVIVVVLFGYHQNKNKFYYRHYPRHLNRRYHCSYHFLQLNNNRGPKVPSGFTYGDGHLLVFMF